MGKSRSLSVITIKALNTFVYIARIRVRLLEDPFEIRILSDSKIIYTVQDYTDFSDKSISRINFHFA